MTFPDGIRWREGYLYVAENASGLSRVDPRTGTRTLIDGSLDQPTSLVFVGGDIWITEGQVLRLQSRRAAEPALQGRPAPPRRSTRHVVMPTTAAPGRKPP